MKTTNLKLSPLLLLLAEGAAQAGGLNLEGFMPSSSPDFMFTEAATVDSAIMGRRDAGSFSLNVQYDFINHPLVELAPNGSSTVVVQSIQSLDLKPGILLTPNLLFSAQIDLASVDLPNSATNYGLSDITFQLKYSLTNDSDAVHFALIPEIAVPTGNVDHQLSTGSASFGMRLAVDHDFGFLKFAGNLGFRDQPGATYLSLDYQRQVLLSIGAEIPLSQRVSLNTEASGYASVPFNSVNSPGEYFLGGMYKISHSSILSGGVSTSGLRDDGNEGIRAVVGFKFFPAAEGGSRAVASESASSQPSCRVRPFSASFPSRALKAGEMSGLGDLPYLSDVYVSTHGGSGHIETLNLGQMTAVTPGGIPLVDDAQIPFAIEMTGLPAQADVISIERAQLKMNVTKVSNDGYLNTELLCFLGAKVCSGGVITKKNWHNAVNWDFFPGGHAANDVFSKSYLGRAVGSYKGQNIYSSELTLDIADLLQGTHVTPSDVIFGDKNGNEAVSKNTLFLEVADDTFVSSNTRLELLMTIKVCE